VNAGSSSIKLAYFLIGSEPNSHQNTSLLELTAVNIGQPSAALHIRLNGQPPQEYHQAIANHEAAALLLLGKLSDETPLANIAAVGHRIVHGGPHYAGPQHITEEVERDLQTLAGLDPEHTPIALRLIHILRQRLPDARQVACFDTAFFHDLPAVAQIIPLPQKYRQQGLRRYGFHGLSYDYLLSSFGRIAGETAANGRVILAHLGSGASLAAIHHGKPVDITMGFTPVSGITMSTRSGDIDPDVAWYLQQQFGVSTEEYHRIIHSESGLLGVSGSSADMRTLLEHEATDQSAALAVELFCYDVKKAIGALSATLGGLDSLIFSGGIGEQSAIIRARVCAGLGFLGIELDEAANAKHRELIASDASRVGVHVLPTNEAQVIYQQTLQAINRHKD
jgi:acetate kinase